MTVAIKINFRQRLLEKQLREKRRIDDKEIHQETGTPYKTIERWDKGKVTQIDTRVLERWCKYLDCNVGDLLEYVPD